MECFQIKRILVEENSGRAGLPLCQEKERANHSSFLAWEIPWTEEPGTLQSIRSQRVRHDLVTKTKTTTLPKLVKLCGKRLRLFEGE